MTLIVQICMKLILTPFCLKLSHVAISEPQQRKKWLRGEMHAEQLLSLPKKTCGEISHFLVFACLYSNKKIIIKKTNNKKNKTVSHEYILGFACREPCNTTKTK